jgi:VWFA-related protein
MANEKHMRRTSLHIAFITLAALYLGWTTASAQQQGRSEQRPRRVGSSQSTTATPQPSTPAKSDEEVDEGDVVRVETQVVSVPAVVRDGNGRLVTGLHAENFVVYEDGRPQQITNFTTTEAPFEVALLLDTSGSTRADVALIRRAASLFIEALRTGDRVSIISFNTRKDGDETLATVEVKTALTSDRATLRKALENVGVSNGTPFYDALERVAEEVFREAPREELRGRRALVALTDGVDSTSDAEFAEVRSRLLRTGVASYFIQVNTEDFVEERLMSDCRDKGMLRLSRVQLQRYRRIFAPKADARDFQDFCQMGLFERMQVSRTLYNLARREMDDLAKASGGKTFPVADLRDARQAFASVAEEIGTQYSLGYYPTNKTRDGRFRAIRVEVKGMKQGAQVRAREGYYAPKS